MSDFRFTGFFSAQVKSAMSSWHKSDIA